MKKNKPRKLLFIPGNNIGDTVIISSILRHFRELYPDIHITAVLPPHYTGLLETLPNATIVVSKGRWKKRLLLFYRFWDVVIQKNGIALPFFWIKKNIIANIFSKHHRPSFNKYFLCGEKIGREKDIPAPYIFIAEKNKKKAKAFIKNKSKALAISPFASEWVKEWPVDFFSEIALRLTAKDGLMAGAPIFLFGAPHQRSQSAYFHRVFSNRDFINFIGMDNDLLDVAAYIDRCRFFLCSDGGLAHLLAATSNIPILDLFFHVDANAWKPLRKRIYTLNAPVLSVEWNASRDGSALLDVDIVYKKCCDILTEDRFLK